MVRGDCHRNESSWKGTSAGVAVNVPTCGAGTTGAGAGAPLFFERAQKKLGRMVGKKVAAIVADGEE